jgi:ankyrin repeat protein
VNHLFLAVRHADKALFQHLTSKSYSFEHLNRKEDTLLHAACVSCNIEMIKMVRAYLNAANQDYVDKKNKQGNTCLHLACEWGSLEVVQYLIDKSFSIEQQNMQGETPLHISILYDHLHVFNYLLDEHLCDIDVNICNANGETPLHLAAFNQSLEYAQRIISSSSFNSMDAPDSFGDTPIFNACRAQNSDMISLLMEQKCDLLAINKYGETIVNVALRLEMLDVLDCF